MLKIKKHFSIVRFAVLVGLLCSIPLAKCEALPGDIKNVHSSVIAECRQRLEPVKKQVPDITQCAEAVARVWAKNKNVLLHVNYGGSSVNFSAELWLRAGGLDNVQSLSQRIDQRTKNDVFLFGQRSWEEGTEDLRKLLVEAKSHGWTTIVFASKKGMPADLPIDYLIDNGATGGGENEAAMNEIVNVINGWLWCSELTAALTREGYSPAVLKGMMLPGSTAHNKIYQQASPKLYPCDRKISAGRLAHAYLNAIKSRLNDLDSPAMQAQVTRAADYAVAHIQSGHAVWAMSFTHMLSCGVVPDLKSPMKGFVLPDDEPESTVVRFVKPGDLLFFFGEWSLNMPDTDYIGIIRRTKADYIPSYRTGDEPLEPLPGAANAYDHDVKDALMVLEQHWPLDNAVVPIPFAPGKMAPVSGVYVALLYRMLDEAIAKDLAMTRSAF